MVLKNRLDYGFNGYRFPVIPRAPRSLRKRASCKKLVEDGQICAFELLAAVAGKLLQESEGSASSNAAEGKVQFDIHKDGIKQEVIEVKAVKSECHDQGSCIESASVPEFAALHRSLKSTVKELPHTENDSVLQRTSVVTSSDLSNKVGCDVKLKICKNKNAVGNILSKPEGGSPDDGESYDGNIEHEAERQLDAAGKKTGDSTVANACGLKNPIELCVNSQILINSDSSVQLPMYRDPVPNASFPRHRNDVNIVTRDDDENSFRFNHPNKRRAFRPQSRMGYRRIRKMLTSRYWKVAPKLKDYELANTGRGLKPYYHKRKPIYTRERYQSEALSKRRKLFDHSSTVAYDPDASSESISNSPEKAAKGDKSLSSTNSHRVGVTSSGVRHRVPFQSKGPPVKFSIKSLRVPELYIEVPETATVGSLKRTVLEAVTAILGGELRIGVLLQGKKVRDDNRTLQQTGISHSGDLNTLGFMLEPSFTQASSPLSQKDSPFLLPCDAHKQSSRSPARPNLDSGFFNASFDPSLATNLDSHLENNQENVHSPIDTTTDTTVPDSKALVLLSALSVDALDVVPLNQKSKRSELSQRRTRRPFSVSEVEALVEAVEKLGTGRWRDVKMRAFDDANHRTYVDLKDKWKTLVHTASIAPQQRRGEPVPQELLDRVLAAHAYWSQHQSKQQGKHQIEPLREIGI